MNPRLIKVIGLILTVLFVVTLIPPSPIQAAVFSNTAAIPVPAAGTDGPSSPYPSTIDVSGLTGTVTRVTVTLNNLSHTYPGDLYVLLVGPNGQRVILMADAGDDPDAVGATLTFDDAAAGVIPEGGPVISGTYQPSDWDGTGDSLPAPAPLRPYETSLGVFNGTNPNGTWNLYVWDDSGGDTGTIAGGWSLDITTTGAPGAPVLTGAPLITWFPGYRDNRINWREAYSPVALYGIDYGAGRFGLHVYNIGAGGPEPWLIVTPDMIAAAPEHLTQHTLIGQTPDGHIRVYRLTTGWFQVMAGPNAEGKTSIIVFDRLCIGFNCAVYALGEIDPQ